MTAKMFLCGLRRALKTNERSAYKTSKIKNSKEMELLPYLGDKYVTIE